jgi:hypothetical protein
LNYKRGVNLFLAGNQNDCQLGRGYAGDESRVYFQLSAKRGLWLFLIRFLLILRFLFRHLRRISGDVAHVTGRSDHSDADKMADSMNDLALKATEIAAHW